MHFAMQLLCISKLNIIVLYCMKCNVAYLTFQQAAKHLRTYIRMIYYIFMDKFLLQQ